MPPAGWRKQDHMAGPKNMTLERPTEAAQAPIEDTPEIMVSAPVVALTPRQAAQNRKDGASTGKQTHTEGYLLAIGAYRNAHGMLVHVHKQALDPKRMRDPRDGQVKMYAVTAPVEREVALSLEEARLKGTDYWDAGRGCWVLYGTKAQLDSPENLGTNYQFQNLIFEEITDDVETLMVADAATAESED